MPMAAAPDCVKRGIWTRIIMALCESYESQTTVHHYSKLSAASDLHIQLRRLRLVSILFHSIIQPFLYRLPIIYRLTTSGRSFVDKLVNNSTLGEHVKWLFIMPNCRPRSLLVLDSGTDTDTDTATETDLGTAASPYASESDSHTDVNLGLNGTPELDSDVEGGSEIDLVPSINSNSVFDLDQLHEPGPDTLSNSDSDFGLTSESVEESTTGSDSETEHIVVPELPSAPMSKQLNPTKALIARRMLQIILRTSNLVALHGIKVTRFVEGESWRATECCIDWAGFKALADVAGHSVVEITNVEIVHTEEEEPRSPAVFSAFAALRTLEWKSRISFTCPSGGIPTDALLRVERLFFRRYDPTIFTVLAHMKLPILTTLGFKRPEMDALELLTAHGTKIRRFELDQQGELPVLEKCPDLVYLVFTNDETLPDIRYPWCSQLHQSLEKIVIMTGWSSIGKKPRSDEVHRWTRFLEKLDLSPFPALRELQLFRCVWPVRDRDARTSPWPRLVEPVIERWDVSVTDANGLAWRPRMRVSVD